jgi:saccharopine dehydrogenase-like NADP-dependent oxidoreductase
MSHIPDMVEKTLRYPGTISYLKALRELGYFSYDEIEVDGKMIKPIDLTAKLLFPQWKLEKGEVEFTIMRVNVGGIEGGKSVNYQYDLYDEYEPKSDTLSMSRTTGYTCSGVGEMLLKGMIKDHGVLAPEMVGAEAKNFEFLIDYLKKRNVIYRVTKK